MATGAATVTVKFLGDLADLQKKTGDAGDTVGGFGDKMKQVGGNIAQAFAGLGVVDFLKNATEAAAEDQAAHERLATSLKNSIGAWDGTTDSVEKWITKMQFAKGFSDNDLRESMASLVEVTHNVSDAQTLAGTAMDIARAKGIPLAQATDLLAKAHEGNTKALIAQFPELKQLQNAHASTAEIIDTVTNAVKGQADTFAGTATGKTEIFHQKLGELNESIGAHLLPVMSGLADALNKIIDWFSSLPGPVQNGIVVVLGIGAALVALNGALGVATAAAAAFGVTLNLSLGPIALVIAAIAAIGIAIYELVKHWDTVKAAFSDALGWIKDRFTDAKNWISDRVGDIVNFFTGLPGRIVQVSRGMWDGIKDAFREAINWIINGWNNLQFKIPGFDFGPVHWSGFTLGVPDIPTLDTGGIVTRPTLAMLAANNVPEAVIPLNRATTPTVVNNTINITGAVDKAGVARELEDILYRFQQQGGTLRFVS